jgi:PIN domain nuclease of toxin-antitoxin system
MRKPERLLIDTHIWIWLMEGVDEFSTEQVSRLDRAAQSRNLFLSAISPWEVATLASKGRIALPIPLAEWMRRAVHQPGLQLLPLTPEISVESAQLVDFHGDPADRMIVATARLEELTLATRDRRILTWAKSGRLKAIPF